MLLRVTRIFHPNKFISKDKKIEIFNRISFNETRQKYFGNRTKINFKNPTDGKTVKKVYYDRRTAELDYRLVKLRRIF